MDQKDVIEFFWDRLGAGGDLEGIYVGKVHSIVTTEKGNTCTFRHVGVIAIANALMTLKGVYCFYYNNIKIGIVQNGGKGSKFDLDKAVEILNSSEDLDLELAKIYGALWRRGLMVGTEIEVKNKHGQYVPAVAVYYDHTICGYALINKNGTVSKRNLILYGNTEFRIKNTK